MFHCQCPNKFYNKNSPVEIFGSYNDSIKIYYNSQTLCNKNEALYYRIGKVDTVTDNKYVVTGEFEDYYMNGQLYMESTMANGKIDGKATFYYPNGTIEKEGAYRQNNRIGTWTFYYPDGKLEAEYKYKNGEPLVWNAYSSNGKQTVKNGNGEYTITLLNRNLNFFSNMDKETNETATGKIKNGKMNGNWYSVITKQD